MVDPSTEFNKAPIEIGQPGVATEAWVAVWGNRGRGHVMIGAPTLKALEMRWEQITNLDFDPTLAQHVYVCKTAIAAPLLGRGPKFSPDWT